MKDLQEKLAEEVEKLEDEIHPEKADDGGGLPPDPTHPPPPPKPPHQQ